MNKQSDTGQQRAEQQDNLPWHQGDTTNTPICKAAREEERRGWEKSESAIDHTH